jgi:hypothetical protein
LNDLADEPADHGRKLICVVACCVVAITVSSCSPKTASTASAAPPTPEGWCTDPNTLSTVADILFENAFRAIDGFGADGTFRHPEAVKEQLTLFGKERPLQIDTEALETFDPANRRVTCSANLHYLLPASDKTPQSKAAMRRISGLHVPPDLLGTAPESRLEFSVQPSPGGHDSVVTVVDAEETSSALLMVAIVRDTRADRSRP